MPWYRDISRICLLLALVVRPAAAQILAPITLAYNDRPPYILSLPDGSAAGLTATPAAQAFKAAGIPVIWKKSPTNRQLAELKENTDRQCAVGWFKNPEGTVAYEYKGEKLAEAPRSDGPDSKRDSLDWSVKDPRKPRLGANGKPLPMKAGGHSNH